MNLWFSIFKGFLLSAPFFRGLRRLDFRKIGEKSFTKLWALDCWFSRTKSSAFFALKKGAADWRYDMNEECDVTRSVSKMTEIEGRGGKRWDKPKKAGKSRDCRGGKF